MRHIINLRDNTRKIIPPIRFVLKYAQFKNFLTKCYQLISTTIKNFQNLLFPLLLILSVSSHAEPWFTGPILAPAGKTTPRGHVNLENYVFYSENIGEFNRHWRLIHTLSGQSYQENPVLSYGLADRVDFQFSLPYAVNRNKGKTAHHIGDTAATLGIQVFQQNQSLWKPNLRLTLQQVFPTGRYEDLNPTNEGTDGTGLGSYETSLGLNFEHLSLIARDYYLRTRLSLNYLFASTTSIRGLNNYGGNQVTNGRVNPGDMMSVDLAGEFALTQHWVGVMEAYFVYRNGATFRGAPGIKEDGLPLQIGSGDVVELSFAPAIEYNFSEKYGVIAGVWFSEIGKDAPDFRSIVVALNIYW